MWVWVTPFILYDNDTIVNGQSGNVRVRSWILDHEVVSLTPRLPVRMLWNDYYLDGWLSVDG